MILAHAALVLEFLSVFGRNAHSRLFEAFPQMAAPTPLELEIEAASGSENIEFQKAVLFHKLL
jgi:hypothetical protein